MYVFDEFFASGFDESISPFLTRTSKKWGRNLSLKGAILAAILLATSGFTTGPFSMVSLLFVYLLAGTPALIRTVNDLKNFELNIDTLMTVAAFLSVTIGSEMEGGLLLVLFHFSSAMEESVSAKTKGTLHALTKLSPAMATVIEGDVTFEKSVREIETNTQVLVQAGEVIPLDGEIIDGRSSLSLVHLTGESKPVGKGVGDEVQAGSHNLDGTLTIRVTKRSSESTLSRIIKLIEHAHESKPKLERFIDKFGKRYSSIILLLFFLFALILPIFLPFDTAIYRALAFLIAASPCALIIATPTAYLSAISACARSGILLKGGIMLDALAKCTTFAFDKTGTITTGEFSLVTPITDEELAVASALERHSTHPIAKSLTKLAEEKNITPTPLENFEVIPGYGVKSKTASIGNWEHSPSDQEETITYLTIGNTTKELCFRDTIRPEMKHVMRELKNIIMITGDHEKSASRIAKDVGISTFHANLRPDDKLSLVADLSKDHLAMIGDGINDAPALARATVGISLGEIGSGAAIEASDIVILRDDLTRLPWLVKKARTTTRIVRQNVILALGVILFATTPAILGLVPLWLAVLLHEGGTLLVGLNSLRLLRK